jgi:2-polyprenyl-3-methyl-5-hydroxy-6-metoxy-1,4-benzoquinol methylase
MTIMASPQQHTSVLTQVRTEHPIANESLDHLQPRGTAHDNSRNRRFNRKLYSLYPAWQRPLRILDLGCAGGAFVGDCLSDGQVAVGIDGSDYSLRWGRAQWPALAGRALFTADIARSFEVVRIDGATSATMTFDVVTLWEVLEHIAEDDLPGVFRNVASHLEPGGIVIASISMEPLPHHQTVHDRRWWHAMFVHEGLTPVPALVDYFRTQFVRGPRFNAEGSFHLIATNISARAPVPVPTRGVVRLLDRFWFGSTVQRQIAQLIGIE